MLNSKENQVLRNLIIAVCLVFDAPACVTKDAINSCDACEESALADPSPSVYGQSTIEEVGIYETNVSSRSQSLSYHHAEHSVEHLESSLTVSNPSSSLLASTGRNNLATLAGKRRPVDMW
jgi:hypothetical protein